MNDRMHGSRFVTSSLDMTQVHHQPKVKEVDMNKMVFRDATGRLVEFSVCIFGLTTIPAVFSEHVGDGKRPKLAKGVEKWLDDILLHSKILEEHFDSVHFD